MNNILFTNVKLKHSTFIIIIIIFIHKNNKNAKFLKCIFNGDAFF